MKHLIIIPESLEEVLDIIEADLEFISLNRMNDNIPIFILREEQYN